MATKNTDSDRISPSRKNPVLLRSKSALMFFLISMDKQ